jgi:hypothetical protein
LKERKKDTTLRAVDFEGRWFFFAYYYLNRMRTSTEIAAFPHWRPSALGGIYLIQSPSTFSAGKNVVTTFPDCPEIHIIIDFLFTISVAGLYSILDWKKILRLNICRLEKKIQPVA